VNTFITFMISPTGRAVRLIAGIVLVAWGLLGITGVAGAVIAVVGAVPLLAGLFDLCVFAPLFGASLKGAEIRSNV